MSLAFSYTSDPTMMRGGVDATFARSIPGLTTTTSQDVPTKRIETNSDDLMTESPTGVGDFEPLKNSGHDAGTEGSQRLSDTSGTERTDPQSDSQYMIDFSTLYTDDHKTLRSHSVGPILTASGHSRRDDSNHAGLATRAVQEFIPKKIIPSVLGPEPRGSFIVSARDKKRGAVAILFTADQVKVVPLIGCGRDNESSWNAARKLEEEIVLKRNVVKPGSSPYSRYLQAGKDVVARESAWRHILDRTIGGRTEAPPDRSPLIRRSLRQAKASVGFSTAKDDIAAAWLVERTRMKPRVVNRYSEDDDQVCMVCQDDSTMYASISNILSCGHCVCVECWGTRIDTTAATGGRAKIPCPAEGCKSSIDLLDAAHILFDETDDDEELDEHVSMVFGQLVRNEIHHFGQTKLRGRFCPVTNCDRLLVRAFNKSKRDSGWNVFQCVCGCSMCADCPEVERSHPGLPCSAYRRLREAVNSGKAEAEYARRMKQRSSRRSSLPANGNMDEDDGGNTNQKLRESQRSMDNSRGGKSSRRGRRHSLDMSGRSSGIDKSRGRSARSSRRGSMGSKASQGGNGDADLRELGMIVDNYRKFRQAEVDLVALEQACDECDPDDEDMQRLLLARQIQQAIFWLSAVLAHDMKRNVLVPLKRLEMMQHALGIRMRREELRKAGNQEKLSPLAEIAIAMRDFRSNGGFDDAEGGRETPDAEQTRLFVDQELQELCLMNSDIFKVAVSEAIRRGVRMLRSGPSSRVSRSPGPGRRMGDSLRQSDRSYPRQSALSHVDPSSRGSISSRGLSSGSKEEEEDVAVKVKDFLKEDLSRRPLDTIEFQESDDPHLSDFENCENPHGSRSRRSSWTGGAKPDE